MGDNDSWGPLSPLDDSQLPPERRFDQPPPRLSDRDYARLQRGVGGAPRRKGLGRFGVLGVIALTVLGKAKWLVAGLKFLKLGPLLSMFVTIGAYALVFGWPFAVGFVLLILIHEMGHAVALKQQGIPASAPVFIPFVGAFIAMKGRPRDAFVEAIVGIGGPILGTIGAAACLAAGFALDSDFLFALASVGFLINLFNMIPVSPLDGGRVVGAISRWFWVVGYALGIGVFVLTWSPILLIILLLGLLAVWNSVRRPAEGYYDIAAWKRVAMGAAYFVMLGLMAIGMTAADAQLTHLLSGEQALLTGGAALTAFGGLVGRRL